MIKYTDMDNFRLNHTARSYPQLPYQKIKESILGKRYALSLNFIGSTRARQLNQNYRQKDYVPNVLSFPLTKNTGEIFITPTKAKSESRKYGHDYPTHAAYLFIHGLLHLKGLDHGPRMEKLEQKYLEFIFSKLTK